MAKIFGSNRPDVLSASDDGDLLIGWDRGNAPGDEGPSNDRDSLTGGAGNDTLRGGAGADSLAGGKGADRLFGGAGQDQVTYVLGDGPDLADGGLGIDMLVLDATAAVGALTFGFSDGAFRGLTFKGFERLWFLGGQGDDSIVGGDLGDRLVGEDGNDLLTGGLGDDRIYGELGRDRLFGGDGADALGGGDGNDRLTSGTGRDILFGGEGADAFVFAEAGDENFDMIEDFDGSEDRIFLEADVFKGFVEGKLRAAQFVLGIEAKDADDRVIYDSKTGRIWLDVDGNGEGQKILLAKIDVGLTLNAGDFLII